MIEEVKKNIKKYPDIELQIINTNDKRVIKENGISRGILMRGKPLIKRMASWSEINNKFKTQLKNK